ncbi:PAS domain S-box-containing protein [Clostridium punense]|uniref:PAS domain S-box-containing protein n=1 Tax=Clostridium punense TaxID=1054297 RepID=A0ABS4JY86_9CLOT|nr:SpoIIE family protein phosphatase [Clostridium punense]MBP2020486.1 PAS domain S-box-containing protein [Clostridium punense]
MENHTKDPCLISMEKTKDKDIKSYYSLNKGIIDENELIKSKIFDAVFKGITDIIGVYKPDGTIMFYNEVGYEFFKKTPSQMEGKKCYEMLGRCTRCSNCTTMEVLNTKTMMKLEKYMPEIDRYMDVTCNPVFDEEGNIVLVVEQLRDITKEKKLQQELIESEERYRRIIDLSPDAIVVLVDGKIVLANKEAARIADTTKEKLIGLSIETFVSIEYHSLIQARIEYILREKVSSPLFDYKLITLHSNVIDVQVSSKYVIYGGRPAIQCVIRDITEYKKSLNTALKEQIKSLEKIFPIKSKAVLETLYIPSKILSGDYYIIKKISEDLVLGVLFDVSGKGVSAAMSISAFRVLFQEAMNVFTNPKELLDELNKKVSDYLDESYIAACCFSFNFKENQLKVVGAGINRFMYQSEHIIEEKIVKGPFLGMFPNSLFDEEVIQVNKGDRIFFFTDGLDIVFDDEKITSEVVNLQNVGITKDYIYSRFMDKTLDVNVLVDDSTLLIVEIL